MQALANSYIFQFFQQFLPTFPKNDAHEKQVTVQ